MKSKLFLTILAVMLLTAVFLAVPVSAAKTSGTCGENLTWAFDSASGTLTISGQGKMDFNDDFPGWMGNSNKITQVIINDGCTSIDHGAFSSYGNLKSVSLPESLKHIGEYAFSQCYNLTDISLEHVTSIGEFAFRYCSGLTELTVPEGLTQIGYGAFSFCRQLSKVVLHDNVTTIDSYAFSDCVSLTSVTIPDSVKTIGDSAFSFCTRLSDFTFGSGVTSLGDNVFSGCSSLESIKIPDKVTELKGYLFSNCTALKEVVIGAGVSKINAQAFRGCSALKSFSLSNQNSSFSLDQGVIYTKDKTELVLMPEGFSGAYTVLSGTAKIRMYSCYDANLTSVTIPGSVTVIGEYAFDGCDNLKTVTLANGLQEIRSDAFSLTAIQKITFPESLVKIGNFAFFGCSNLKTLIFTGAPPEFGSEAFCEITATAYYPGNIPGWAEAENLYGGLIDWVATCGAKHAPATVSGKAPTCTESGLTDGSRCSICKTVITEQKSIPATGHKFGNWVEVTAPTAQKEGLANRTCSDCGHKEQKKLEKLTQEGSGSVVTQPTEPTKPEQTLPIEPTDPTPPVSTEPADPTQPAPTEPAETEPTQDSTPANTETTTPAETDPTDTQTIEPPEDDNGAPWGAIAAITGVVLLGGAGTAAVILKRKKII